MNLKQHETQTVTGQQTAFTLLEVMIGIAIGCVVFVSLYLAISSGFGIIQATREDLRATQVLQEKMETIRLYTWDQVTNAGFIPSTFTAPFYATNITTATGQAGYSGTVGLTYTGTVTIATSGITDSSYSNNLRQINITLNWQSGSRIRNRSITTFVSQYGLQNYIYY